MKKDSIDDLLEILLHSSNDAWRDDAAEALANCEDVIQAECALLKAIASPKLDDSLRRTCAESISEIWIKSGYVDRDKLNSLTGIAKQVVEDHLVSANVRFTHSNS